MAVDAPDFERVVAFRDSGSAVKDAPDWQRIVTGPGAVNPAFGGFTEAGQLIVGTGAGTGELLDVGASGDVLTVGGADPSGLEWAAGGGGGGGYKSLTGAGETTTPGDLTQAGGFTVDDVNGDGIMLTSADSDSLELLVGTDGTFGPGVFMNEAGQAAGINLLENLGWGVNLTTAGTTPAKIALTAGNNSGLTLSGSASSESTLDDGGSVGLLILTETGHKLGFYGAAPVAQPAAPTTLAEVIAALQALGLVA